MSDVDKKSRFESKLLRPASSSEELSWAFVVLPGSVSDLLPRRGRTTVEGKIQGHPFTTTLEPDGKRSHWLRVSKKLQENAGVEVGDVVAIEVAPVSKEPEPEVPPDLKEALDSAPEARRVWIDTTTIARLDWIHWVTSAKQTRTRAKRIRDACEMLAAGKKRVCCFDPSGFYSKALSAPEAAE